MASVLEQVRAIKADMKSAGAMLTDEQAHTVPAIFMLWDATATYAVGDRVRHNALLYRCLQAHTAQATWTPDSAVSLWVRIDDPAIAWPEWVQPESTNPYAKGAKVTFEGKRYVSLVDGNVWSPTVYAAGWQIQS